VNFVDVALSYPALQAPSVWVQDESFAFDLGVPVALGTWHVRRADLVLLTGLHLSSRANPSDVRVATWDLPIEGGWRWTSPVETALVRPYWELGGGPHLNLVLTSYTPTLVSGAMGTHTGFGATVGRGDTRVVLGVRGSVRVGPDVFYGTVTTPDGDVWWQWTSWGARVDGYLGVQLR
jgi:hypothetical protein